MQTSAKKKTARMKNIIRAKCNNCGWVTKDSEEMFEAMYFGCSNCGEESNLNFISVEVDLNAMQKLPSEGS